MATKAKRHVHKYHLIKIGYGKVWACALPDCNHFMPINMTPMVPGKNSICWGCDNQLILDDDNMQMDRPICDNCIHKQKELVKDIQVKTESNRDKLSNVLSELGLFNEPSDDLDDMIQKTFVKTDNK